MASSYEQIMAEVLANSQKEAAQLVQNYNTPFKSADPVQTEAALRQQKQIQELNAQSGLRAAVANSKDTTTELTPELESDMAKLSPGQLYAKYGPAAERMIELRAQGQTDQFNLSTTKRSAIGKLGDISIDVLSTPVEMLGGILALGVSGESPEGGALIANQVQRFDNWTNGLQSEHLQGRRLLNQTVRNIRSDENQHIRDANVEAGSSPIVEDFMKVGRNVLSSIGSSVEDPSIFTSDAAQAASSLLVGGPIAKGIEGAAALALKPLAKFGVERGLITAARVAQLGEKASEAAFPAAVGLMEGGGAYSQTVNQVMGMSEEELRASSPEYVRLRETMSHDDAKLELADNAGKTAAIIQGSIGALTGKLVEGQEKTLRGVLTAGGNLRSGIIREGIEEGIQGGTGELATNIALAQQVDPNRDLTQGVGEGAGQGLLHGMGVAAMVGAPGAAVTSVVDGVTGLVNNRSNPAPQPSVSPEPIAPTIQETPIEQVQPELDPDAIIAELTTKIQNETAPTEIPVSEEIPPEIENLNKAVEISTSDPIKADPRVNEEILLMADRGDIEITPEQKATLKSASDLVRIQQDYEEKSAVLNKLTRPAPNIVTQEIRSGGGRAPSAAEHMKTIITAYQSGDYDTARDQLEQMQLFAQTLQNKVNALNEGLATGNTDVRYENVIAGTRKIAISQKGLGVTPTSKASVAFAQQVAADAEAVTTLANRLAENLDLGIKPLKTVSLDKSLQGNPVEIAQRFAKQNTTITTPEMTVSEYTDRYIKGEGRNDPAMQQFAINNASEIEAEFQRRKESVDAETSEPTVKTEATSEARPTTEENTTGDLVEAPETFGQRNIGPSDEAIATEREFQQERLAAKRSEEIMNEAIKTEAEFQKERAANRAPKGFDDAPDNQETLDTVLPDLVGSKKEGQFSWFKKAFKLPNQPKTRTQKDPTPFRSVREALSSPEKHEAYLGKKPKKAINQEIAADYQQLFKKGVSIAKALQENLESHLSKKVDGKTWAQHLLDGTQPKNKKGQSYDLRLTVNGKALNLVDEIDGELAYNPKLMGEAVLAGLQWLVVSDRFGTNVDEETAADILDMPVGTFDESVISELNKGLSATEAKRSLASMIKSFWGLVPDRNTDQAVIEGTAEAIAAEMLLAFEKVGLLKTNTIKVEGSEKTPKVYIPFQFKEGDAILANPTAIEDSVLVNPEKHIFINEEPTSVPRTQMNNPRVENSREQRAAALHESKTPYYLNPTMAPFFEQLGLENTLELFGEGDLSKRSLNEQYAKILKGRNTTIESAYNSLIGLIAQLKAEAGDQDINNIPVRFMHNFSSVGRMQMLGKNNPQASKLMREALLSTASTLDLTKSENRSRYLLALAQALGVKVHNKSRSASETEVIDLLNGDLAPVVEMLQNWQKTNKKLSSEQIQTIKEAFGADLDFMGFHAVMDYARYLNTEDRSNYKTQLYIEADGITNGPINAMMMATPGAFTPEWLANVAKGGISFIRPNWTMNEHRQADPVDLYEKAMLNFRNKLGLLREEIADKNDLRSQMNYTLRLMSILLPDVNITPEDGLTFKRGIAKNPLTITLYGSGETGIAGNITHELTTEIYARLSKASEQLKENPDMDVAEAMFGDLATPDQSPEDIYNYFQASLNALTGKVVYRSKGELKIARETNQDNRTLTPETFSFTREQRENMVSNIRHLFVAPMRTAIEDTVGKGLMESMDSLRAATQVQSIFQKFEYAKKVAEATKNKPTGYFLTKAEEDEIFDSLAPLSPFVEMDGQTFYPAGSSKVDLGIAEFGRDLNDSIRSDAYYYGPENSGVRGMPMLIIGPGDALMMQKLATMTNAVKGTLKVFDGVNLPLDQMELGSLQANQAAFEAMMSNPLQAVFKSYDKFMKAVSFDKMPDEQRRMLTEALYDPSQWKGSKTNEELQQAMEVLHSQLKTAAMTVEARHNVLRQTKLSIDQMAAVGAPYQINGSIDLTELSVEEASQILNEKYQQELARLQSEDKEQASEKEAKQVVNALSFKDGDVTRTTHNQLVRMASKLGATPEQLVMLRQILKTLVTKEYQVVMGSMNDIRAWAEKNGRSRIPNEDQTTGQIKGFTVFGDKTIYLTTSSTETLIHELIHAGTFETLVAHYSGENLGTNGKEQAEAIARIEALMNQFLSLDEIGDLSPQARRAYFNAVEAIKDFQNSKSRPEAIRKAGALNEFMAWALTNEQLIKQLKTTKASPLVQLAKDVIKALKQLIWGRQQAPKVGDDMLSNLQFNSSLLMNANADASVKDLIDGVIAFQSTAYGNNDRLAKLEKIFHEKIAAYFDGTIEDQLVRDSEFSNALVHGINVAQSFMAHGFPMTPQEASTFQMIVATLGTQTQLDANSLAEIQELYSHFTRKVLVEDFMKDPNSMDPNDRAQAQEKYNSIVGNYIVAQDKQGRSTLLPAFLALSMTNEDFREVLKKIELPKLKLNEWNSTDNILNNLGHQMMDKLSATMSGADRKAANVQAAIAALEDRIVSVAEERQNWIDRLATPAHNVIDNLNAGIVYGLNKGADKVIEIADQLKTKTNSKIAQQTLDGIKVIVSVVNEEKSSAIRQGVMSQLNKSKTPKPLFDLANEFIGRTAENADIYDMIKLVRSRVQQMRQQFREHLPGVLESKFTRKITENEWTNMFHGFGKTDIASLNDALDLIKDTKKIASAITKQENLVRSLDPKTWSLVERKAKELAHFMNTGEVSSNLLRNAHAVSHLWGELNTSVARNPEYIEAVDRLISLYALDGLSDGMKANLSSLVQTQEEGVSFIIDYLIGQRVEETRKAEASPIALANHYKGFIPSEAKEGYGLIIANDSDKASLLDRGYIRVGNYTGSKSEPGTNQKGYYFSSVASRSTYNQGIMQNVRPTAGGVDPVTGFTNIHMTGGQITDPAMVKRIAQNMKANGGKEPLLPVYNELGEIVAFERGVDPQYEEKLQRSTHLAKMIGVWRGRQVEEIEAVAVNNTLITRLKAMWDADRLLRKDEYINLFDKNGIKDPITRDGISLINSNTRTYIESVFGKDQFWVRKDMLDDALGYRKASIGDFWTGNSRWSPEVQKAFRSVATGIFGPDAYKKLVTAEKLLQNFITDARVTIVVKSVIVPLANLAANFIQLLSRGVPVQDIVRGMTRKTSELDGYVKSRIRQIELEAELRAATNDLVLTRKLKAEIQSIKDARRRLSFWPLIEAGEFASISDAAISREEIMLTEGRLSEYMEKLISKLPGNIKTAARYGLVARDTALFHGLQRAVEYGDFLGKAVLYEHLTQKKKISQADALARITEEFVNYDRLPGRARGYLESSGLIWFWHFKIRSTKIALSMLRNNPLHLILATAIPGLVGAALPGSPVADNAISVLLSDHRLPYAVGLDQALHAHSLNPWVNLFS